ncbi:hypothetical protein [Flexithrix dorotheae]|uniref:hypothetical protein n=1 Tax=Flexithrix dorotheae TaxID=70993 RepID=UPI00036DF219|nr:hypothetical protein [Flexithrix dorotheae]
MRSKKIKMGLGFIAMTLTVLLFSKQEVASQKIILHTNEVKGEKHISKANFPKGNVINMVNGWGGMTVGINEFKAGTDFTPMLQGLKENLCQVPHWGYLEKGKIRVIDSDKASVTIEAGEVFYMPPGHTLIIDEDARIIDFSPEKEMKELNEFVLNKIAQMQNKE